MWTVSSFCTVNVGSCVIVWWLTVLVWCIGIGLWSAKRTYSYSGPFTDPGRAKTLMQARARTELICSCQSLSKENNSHFRLATIPWWCNQGSDDHVAGDVVTQLSSPWCLQGGAGGRGCSSWPSPGCPALVTWTASLGMTSDTWVISLAWPDFSRGVILPENIHCVTKCLSDTKWHQNPSNQRQEKCLAFIFFTGFSKMFHISVGQAPC